MSEQRYTANGTSGWLRVKLQPSGKEISLPEYLKVKYEGSSGGRDTFVVQEGVHAGKKCSVITGYLKIGNPGYKPAARLSFSLNGELLTYPGGRIKAITSETNSIPVGTYPIQIPDFPHPGGSNYTSRSDYAKSWFYLGIGNAVAYNNDRYLHPGAVSAGCITVDANKWTDLYRHLILCRGNDGKTVGTVTVVA
ncbi:hypothetical protein RAS12_08315 [Achromobacter seleniivolatilans]|uniref:YkuD domain-containing protein n=1 Tax=Achromobacter seleniivolatilans TaxID=3047478 RepID=A0ABY9M6Y0_9BURK|nr:hypothetical protein [Achromobacter sp. R39]WMD22368.1 hypothetical protein RAS12_08315 [Achromobacter sp. R39]